MGYGFTLKGAALSKVPLIQKGWVTIPGDKVLEGFFRVNTVTFNDLQAKYDIEFDTLVVDAEGALYQILVDEPHILNNIKLIIIENDFRKANHCFYVVDLFRAYGFELIHNKGQGYYGENAFNQVWKKPFKDSEAWRRWLSRNVWEFQDDVEMNSTDNAYIVAKHRRFTKLFDL